MGVCGCIIGGKEAEQLRAWWQWATVGAVSTDPAWHGCGRCDNGRLWAGGAMTPPAPLSGGGRGVGRSSTARLGHGGERRLRVGGEEAAHPAAAPRPTGADPATLGRIRRGCGQYDGGSGMDLARVTAGGRRGDSGSGSCYAPRRTARPPRW
uniref:Uncharacterized protein n=1 Tax=Oryza barthii TaxID=65489 RepID=A0A0D3G5I0_9ORYZ